MARINRAIELLEQDQPVYFITTAPLTYENGKEQAGTWADVLLVDFEHNAFDMKGLKAFMEGLKDAGPTRRGHPTPSVMTTLPSNCKTREEVIANSWQIRHVLATGVHGIMHCHARQASAVQAFIESCRFAFQTIGVSNGLGIGQRGAGGQAASARIWGVSPTEYVKLADPWPLNPDGELLLGFKIEDHHTVEHVDEIVSVPGVGFAEWAPGDYSMSLGDAEGHDPPYTEEMTRGRVAIRDACKRAGVAYNPSGSQDPTMEVPVRVKFLIEEFNGRFLAARGQEYAAAGRALTGRTMPV